MRLALASSAINFSHKLHDGGFGFAIAKALAEAGASVCVGTWPPALGIFRTLLERGKMDASMTLPDGRKMAFEKVYPLDAEYDALDDVPAEVRDSRRYRECGDFTIGGLAAQMRADFGEGGVDIVVHSLANGPEVKKPLSETRARASSRRSAPRRTRWCRWSGTSGR